MAKYERNEMKIGSVGIVLCEVVKEDKRFYSVALVDNRNVTLKRFYLNDGIEIAYWLDLVRRYEEE